MWPRSALGGMVLGASLSVIALDARAQAQDYEVRQFLPADVQIDSLVVSRDGSHVAFSRSVNGSTQIFLAATDGSEVRQLTCFSDGLQGRIGSMTADGSLVAFTLSILDSNWIHVVTAEGVVRVLGAGSSPRLNADGSRILYSTGSGVFGMDSYGQNPQLLSDRTSGAYLGNIGIAGDRIGAIFPELDGDVIVYHEVSVEWGGPDPDLVLGPWANNLPLLSADENWYATGANDEVVVSSASGSMSWRFTPDPFHIPWVYGISADGSELIVNMGQMIYRTPATSFQANRAFDAGFPIADAAASDDLSVIAYSRSVNYSLGGLWVLTPRRPSVRIDAPREISVGAITPVAFVSEADGGKRFLAAASRLSSLGTRLSDGRIVPLAADALALFSTRPGNGVFIDFRGTLDASGRATGAIQLPDRTDAIGRRFNLGFVVLDRAAPLGIGSISPARQVSVVPRQGCGTVR